MLSKNRPVTIVIPVYGDWPSLNECIESVNEHIDATVHQVMLVNDCGPEADTIEQNILNSIEGLKNFSYYRNKKNLGFIGTCNKAVLELDKTANDILLLNSDAKVTAGFLEEMLEVLYLSSKNGVVSPRSNNATICTIPLWSAAQKGVGARKSYSLYKKMKPKLPQSIEVPVGHGFCLLTKRSLIKKYGLFDPIFGKGYGEEVDYCLRIAIYGYKCLLANYAYVFHQEARSFSLEKKAKLLSKNNKIIWERYPSYRDSVRKYMEAAVSTEKLIEDSTTSVIYKISRKLQARN